jgi:hypothetical protein
MKYVLPQDVKTELAKLAVYGETISPGELRVRLMKLCERIGEIKVVVSIPDA